MTDQLGLDDNEQIKMGRPARGSVECLGLTFDSDDARRQHFSAILAERLRDQAFRRQPGFPVGEDEDILRMSDPPYYTACPNPFLGEFIRVYGKPYDPGTSYHRDPFAVDVSVGKTDALYKAHSYHTKVPHLAIVPSILHYTEPGDIVFDGFCGSGMTGVAAQYCGSAPAEYRLKLEAEWAEQGQRPPQWGARRAILGDLSPAATFIAAGYNIPFDVEEFEREARRILAEVDVELGWMYETLHSDGKTKGRINYTVWSEVFSCAHCGEQVVFLEHAFDFETKSVSATISCPRCSAEASKEQMELLMEAVSTPDGVRHHPKRVPVFIAYEVAGQRFEKRLDDYDRDVLERVQALAPPKGLPRLALGDTQMTRVGRMATTKTQYVDDLFLPRSAHAIAAIWARADQSRLRLPLLYLFEQTIWTMSVLNRFRPSGFSQVSQCLSGVFYVPSQMAEVSLHYVLDGKIKRLARVFAENRFGGSAAVSVSDCAASGLDANSIDYVFTDPPFGENIYYAALNTLVESWHGVVEDGSTEAIMDRVQNKTVHDYQGLMTACFREYYRVLKPGRWITVCFSNSSNSVWRAIQEAMGIAGFVVADVRTLDKKMGSFRQVTSQAVKQDLVISAYKPSRDVGSGGSIEAPDQDAAWAMVVEHMANVPIVVESGGGIEPVLERTPQMLHDRMVGFFVQRELAVPLSASEFMSGLAQRYPERDGMYFLPEQVAEYDKRRAKVASVQQLSLMVIDESSAIQWVRQQLESKPQSFAELQPTFMREAQQSWAKHEVQIELKELLEANFILYDGHGPVPSQIKSYLSTNWREYRNLEAEDESLRDKAKGRWYVPDPGKAADLEKLRERQLLKEFELYRGSKGRKLRVFRTEAVRAGFKRAYDERDWETIVAVAGHLPDSVVQEDEKLLMYYDVARMRVG